MPFVSAENQRCFCRFVNKGSRAGRTLVCVHGAGGDGTVWLRLAEKLGVSCSIVIPDMPGHGKSPGNPLATARQYAVFLAGLIQELHLADFFLAGHSLGGAVVQEYLREFSAGVSGFILAGTGMRFSISQEYLDLVQSNFEAAIELSCSRAYGPGASRGLHREGAAMLQGNGCQTLCSDLIACRQFNSASWIESLGKPALVVCGSMDVIAPPEFSRELAERLPAGRMQTIDGAGHMAMAEYPETFSRILLDFMETAAGAESHKPACWPC